MTEPTPLHITSITSPINNGFNINCFDGHNGTINLNVAGGIVPYSYQWSNGSFDQNPIELNAGHYMVRVFDKNHAEVDGQITLTQPNKLDLSLNPTIYTGGYNISCYNCGNGSIQSTAIGGATPYIYEWSNSQNGISISNLSATNYYLRITDANGCIDRQEISLIQPERED